jgi:glycosyltransferase involved in cell wall biosynthesis
MLNLPKITIVTPVYNRVSFLEATIQSVLSQGYPNLEYIIIDGGSSDGTVEIIKKYESKLKYWVSESDEGMYSAIQKGFENATGDIFAWLNSDDIYHDQSLFIVAEIFSTLNTVNWIIGTPSMFNQKGQLVSVAEMDKWSKIKFETGDYKWIQQESTFWRKQLWEKAGSYLNLDYKLAADFELWTRYFNISDLYSVNTILAGFRLHGNQISMVNKESYENEVGVIHYKQFGENNNLHLKIRKQLFAFQQRSNPKSTLSKLIHNLIKILLKKMYRLPSTIHFDFAINKWTLN